MVNWYLSTVSRTVKDSSGKLRQRGTICNELKPPVFSCAPSSNHHLPPTDFTSDPSTPSVEVWSSAEVCRWWRFHAEELNDAKALISAARWRPRTRDCLLLLLLLLLLLMLLLLLLLRRQWRRRRRRANRRPPRPRRLHIVWVADAGRRPLDGGCWLIPIDIGPAAHPPCRPWGR